MPAVAPGSLLFLLCLWLTLLSRGLAERTVLNKIFTERSRHKHGDGSSEPGPAHKTAEGNDIANVVSAGSDTLGTPPGALSNIPGTKDSGLGVETVTDASNVKSELAEAKKEVSTGVALKRQSLPPSVADSLSKRYSWCLNISSSLRWGRTRFAACRHV